MQQIGNIRHQLAGLAVCGSLLLAGCEGWLGNGSPIFDNDDDGEPDIELQTAEGLWSGTRTAANATESPTQMLVLPGRSAWLLLPDADERYSALVVGELQIDGETLSSEASLFEHEQLGFFRRSGEARLDGSVRSRSQMQLSLRTEVDSVAQTASIEQSYQSGYARTTLTADLAGTYRRSGSDSGEVELVVDEAGHLQGSIADDCQLSGRGSSVDAEKNLFSFSIQTSDDCPYAGLLSGWGWLRLNTAGERSGLSLLVRAEAGSPVLLLQLQRDE